MHYLNTLFNGVKYLKIKQKYDNCFKIINSMVYWFVNYTKKEYKKTFISFYPVDKLSYTLRV